MRDDLGSLQFALMVGLTCGTWLAAAVFDPETLCELALTGHHMVLMNLWKAFERRGAQYSFVSPVTTRCLLYQSGHMALEHSAPT